MRFDRVQMHYRGGGMYLHRYVHTDWLGSIVGSTGTLQVVSTLRMDVISKNAVID